MWGRVTGTGLHYVHTSPRHENPPTREINPRIKIAEHAYPGIWRLSWNFEIKHTGTGKGTSSLTKATTHIRPHIMWVAN